MQTESKISRIPLSEEEKALLKPQRMRFATKGRRVSRETPDLSHLSTSLVFMLPEYRERYNQEAKEYLRSIFKRQLEVGLLYDKTVMTGHTKLRNAFGWEGSFDGFNFWKALLNYCDLCRSREQLATEPTLNSSPLKIPRGAVTVDDEQAYIATLPVVISKPLRRGL